MRAASFFKALTASVALGAIAAAMTSCRAAQAAGDHLSEGGGAVGGGALVYALAVASGVAGWAAAGLAGIGGWLGAWFFTPRAAPGAPHAGFPWTVLILGAVAFALVRAWAHYPAIMRALWQTVKAAARGLLGGLHRPNGGS